MPSLTPAAAAAVATTRVLLVEDNPADAVLVREMLAGPGSEGVDLVQAGSLGEGQDRFPDLGCQLTGGHQHQATRAARQGVSPGQRSDQRNREREGLA